MVIPGPSYINNKLIFIDIQKKDSLIGESWNPVPFHFLKIPCYNVKWLVVIPFPLAEYTSISEEFLWKRTPWMFPSL